MQIAKKLLDDLVEKLARLPLAKTADGRNMFLIGIPHEDWQRNENIIIDITYIIEQAKEIFIGQKAELDNWGLLLVIDSAINKARGTSLATDLQTLRQQCVHSWEKEYGQPRMIAPLIEPQAIHEITLQTISIDPVANEDSIPLDSAAAEVQHNEVLIAFETTTPVYESHQANLYESFFNESNAYIINIRQSISTAFTPFRDQPSGYAEPRECRKSIQQLKQTSGWLRQLLTLIDSTNPLPQVIAENQDDLIERLQYLDDQMHHLIDEIDKGSKNEKEIKSRFAATENELASLTPFMVYFRGNETS